MNFLSRVVKVKYVIYIETLPSCILRSWLKMVEYLYARLGICLKLEEER